MDNWGPYNRALTVANLHWFYVQNYLTSGKKEKHHWNSQQSVAREWSWGKIGSGLQKMNLINAA